MWSEIQDNATGSDRSEDALSHRLSGLPQTRESPRNHEGPGIRLRQVRRVAAGRLPEECVRGDHRAAAAARKAPPRRQRSFAHRLSAHRALAFPRPGGYLRVGIRCARASRMPLPREHEQGAGSIDRGRGNPFRPPSRHRHRFTGRPAARRQWRQRLHAARALRGCRDRCPVPRCRRHSAEHRPASRCREGLRRTPRSPRPS